MSGISRFNVMDHLTSEEARAEYLQAAAETGDPDFMRDAEEIVARAATTPRARDAAETGGNLPKPRPPSDRVMRLCVPLRRHFGEKFGGEPSMVFRPDGTVRVVVGAHIAELTAAEVEAFDV